MKGTLYWKKAPSFGWDVKPRSWLSVVIKKSQDVLRKRVGVLPRHPGQTSLLASDHHGLLIIPIHWLASSLCLLSTNKRVYGGRSGALWLPLHHPGGCCTLVVDEEIAPLLCSELWVSRKALYKCNKLLLLLTHPLFSPKSASYELLIWAQIYVLIWSWAVFVSRWQGADWKFC